MLVTKKVQFVDFEGFVNLAVHIAFANVLIHVFHVDFFYFVDLLNLSISLISSIFVNFVDFIYVAKFLIFIDFADYVISVDF